MYAIFEEIDYDAVDNYKVTIIFDDEDNLAGARPTVLGTVLRNTTTKEQRALNAASNKPLKSPTVVTFKDVPRYNDNKTLATWEVRPGQGRKRGIRHHAGRDGRERVHGDVPPGACV